MKWFSLVTSNPRYRKTKAAKFILQRQSPSTSSMCWGMVPRRRLELPRPCGHWHLKPARLPIPPPGHRGLWYLPDGTRRNGAQYTLPNFSVNNLFEGFAKRVFENRPPSQDIRKILIFPLIRDHAEWSNKYLRTPFKRFRP